MTSRRRSRAASGWRHGLLALGVAGWLAGCASLPEDQPVMEQIDNETGVTVTRLGKPVEIFRETFLSQAPGRFGFLAPFETNHMGHRELFLWIAVPVDPAPNAEPTLTIDGAAVPLEKAGRDPEFAGLRKAPYRIATPWSAMFYVRVDAAVIEKLANANQVIVDIFEATKDGAAKIQFATSPDDRFRQFANRP